MPGIQDFIQIAQQKLGVSADAASSGVGGIVNLIKEHAGAVDLGKLTSAIPGLGALASKAPSGGGGVLGALGGLLGGGAGQAGVLAGMLGKAGISADKIPGFLASFIDFLKSHVSLDTLKGILAKVGPLKDMLPK